jgi:uncharacterized protein (DUF2384 family)
MAKARPITAKVASPLPQPAAPPTGAPSATPPPFVTGFMSKEGVVDIGRVAAAFRMSKTQLALTIGLGHAAVSKTDRSTAPKAQTRVTEMLEIINRVRGWAGGEAHAMAWYRSQPIPALDGRTPEALVKAGRAHAVRDYLDHLALGGFA